MHPEGLGVSYHMPSHELRFGVTSFAGDASRFCAELEAALSHIERLLSLE